MTDATASRRRRRKGSGYASGPPGAPAGSTPPGRRPEAVASEARRTRGERRRPRRVPRRPRAVRDRRAPLLLLLRHVRASALLEERSWFAGRLGRSLTRRSRLRTTPSIPADSPIPSTSKERRSTRPSWSRQGVARGVVWDRTTALSRRTARTPPATHPLQSCATGARCPPRSPCRRRRRIGGGARGARRRRPLHHASALSRRRHPREGAITGMTRDGTFRIRDGKIAEPLVNLRFTVAVPDFLRASRLTNRPSPARRTSTASSPNGVLYAGDRSGALCRHRSRLEARDLTTE